MLPPFLAIVVKGDLRRVAHQLGQRFDRTASAAVPIAGEHPVSKCVPSRIRRELAFDRMFVPAQVSLDRQEASYPCHLLPGISLRIAKQGFS